jgi:mono/diheme cytochrome c family protein
LSLRLLCATTIALFCVSAEGTSNQSPWDEIYKSNWAGIYTTDQAARGQSAYRARCASCHGTTLEGSDDAPPLAGPDFAEDWNCANIADLFEKIQYTMAANRPDRLEQEQVAEILSYILKVNLFPAGDRMLPANVDDLRGLLFFARNPNRQ